MARKPARQFRSAARTAKGVRTVLVRLGRQVRALRNERGLTQEGLGQAAELDPKHIQLIEAGGTNPTVATLVAVARGLKVDVAELFQQDA